MADTDFGKKKTTWENAKAKKAELELAVTTKKGEMDKANEALKVLTAAAEKEVEAVKTLVSEITVLRGKVTSAIGELKKARDAQAEVQKEVDKADKDVLAKQALLDKALEVCKGKKYDQYIIDV